MTFIDFFRHDGTDSPAEAADVIVVLNSFHSKIIKVRVRASPRYIYSVLNALKSMLSLNCSAESFLDELGPRGPQIMGVRAVLFSVS